jgi:hypothetical protein
MLTVSTQSIGRVFIGLILSADEVVFQTPGFDTRKAAYKAAQRVRLELQRNLQTLPNPFAA